MNMPGEQDEFRRELETQTRRRAESEQSLRKILLGMAFLGTLAVLFLFPVIVGLYLGKWLDDQSVEFQYRWTINLLLLGIVLGIVNVVLFIRERMRDE
jgi:ATP synthase protein I